MKKAQSFTVDFVSHDDITVDDKNKEQPYIGEFIDAVNDGLIDEVGQYKVDVTKTGKRFMFNAFKK